MKDLDYWKECISIAADECGLDMTSEQLEELAEGVSGGHENYGMAFYSPPASERLDDIENEWKQKLKDLQSEFNAYRHNAETAIKQALRQRRDSNVSIGDHGEVLRHDGRTTQIQ